MMTEDEMVQSIVDALGVTWLKAMGLLEQAAETLDETCEDYDNKAAFDLALATACGKMR
jgi:hypothetical protein